MERQQKMEPDQSDQPEQKEKTWRKLGLFSVILGELIGYTGAGIGLGYIAWIKWGAPKWVFVITGAIGMALAFYQIYRVTQKEL